MHCMSNPNSKTASYGYGPLKTLPRMLISVNRHRRWHLQEISFLHSKAGAHRKLSNLISCCIVFQKEMLKLSHTNPLFTWRCTNEMLVPHLKESIYYTKLMALSMTVKEQADSETICWEKDFTLKNTCARAHYFTNSSTGGRRLFYTSLRQGEVFS